MKKQRWYKFHVGECPVCGRNQGWKELMSGKKPKLLKDRYVYIPYHELYDYCDAG